MSSTGRPRLGPFEIGELIGTGGFASVYRAYDERLNCDVAIKILAENHAMNPDVRERFIREAQALRLIDSPSVISIYDIGETPDGRPYLVIEYADRGGLMERRRQYLNNGSQPTTNDVGYLINALADALEPIHAEQLVHRDVTPSNVLIRSANRSDPNAESSLFAQDERLMLSDLGLVKDLINSSGLTAGSGTAGFAAPEQQQLLSTIDARSDIYSATAVILWFILGQSPRAVEGIEGRLRQDGWPKPFRDALMMGIAEQPDERHHTIGEWKIDLLSDLPLGQQGSSLPGLGRGRQRRRLSRIGYVVAGLLAGAGAAVAAVSFWPDNSAGTNDDVSETIASAATVEAEQATPLDQADVTAPRPDLQHFHFDTDGERTILEIIWGAQVVPSNVVATAVAIAVDGGDWVIEKTPEQNSARGYQLYSTDNGTGERLPVALDTQYVAKVRWVFEDGTTTDWSRQLTVAPTE